ncbi:MAG: PAS domain S-box protein [Sphingobium sp.]
MSPASGFSIEGSRYPIALLSILFTAVFLWIDRTYLFLGKDFLVCTLVVTGVVLALGIGPGLVVTLGILSLRALWPGRDILSLDPVPQDLAFFTLILCANAVALKSTLWRIRAERRAATARQLSEQLGLMMDGDVRYALYMVNDEGHISHWNPGSERLTGWQATETAGRYAGFLYGERGTRRFEEAMQEAREHGTATFDAEVRRADGSVFRQWCSVTRLMGEAGDQPRGFAKFVRDISKEHEQEVELRNRENELRCVLQSAPDAVILTDADGCIRYLNASAVDIFGQDSAALLGAGVDQLLPALANGHPVGLPAMAGKAARASHKLSGRRSGGDNFPAEVRIASVPVEEGMRYTLFVRDLTEQEATSARLEALQMEMLHGSRYSAMGAMASMLAHELNQPLTAITAYMEGSRILLSRSGGCDPEKLGEIFAATSREALRAGQIMTHLRHFVKSGEAVLALHEVKEIVDTSIPLIQGMATSAAVTIERRLPGDIGLVFADIVQIQQVMSNLCRNAIDAMRDSAERRLTIEAWNVDELSVEFAVRDTGPGIDPAIAERLFDAFVSSKEEGMGVGLSICRTIVEAHGGRIWVTTGEGTAFHFTLRRRKE